MVGDAHGVLTGFAAEFRLPELVLIRKQHWTLSLRPAQVTLGSMVISANEAATSFAEVGTDAAAELLATMADAERVARRLGAERVNFLALMMKDPLVHLHVLPRYSAPVEFAGRTWTDDAWPGPPGLTPQRVTEEELIELLSAVAAHAAA